MSDQTEGLIYAVWIAGEGWLRAGGDHIFADHRREVAESAASFIRGGRVIITDLDAMPQLEKRFLREELDAAARAALDEMARRDATMSGQLRRFGRWLQKTVGRIIRLTA